MFLAKSQFVRTNNFKCLSPIPKSGDIGRGYFSNVFHYYSNLKWNKNFNFGNKMFNKKHLLFNTNTSLLNTTIKYNFTSSMILSRQENENNKLIINIIKKRKNDEEDEENRERNSFRDSLIMWALSPLGLFFLDHTRPEPGDDYPLPLSTHSPSGSTYFILVFILLF